MPKANSAAHTKWLCKYHIVFTPKYRRKIIYNQYKKDLAQILHDLCAYKGVEIIEGHLMPDHVHMLVSIPPKISVSSFMGYLKGKSSLMMFDRHANLKYKFGNRHFWAEGYYVSTGGISLSYKQEAMDSVRERYGFFVLISNEVKDPVTALRLYRMRDVIEKAFRNIKERLNLRRTLTSSESSLEGKFFVEFVALIYLSYIKKKME